MLCLTFAPRVRIPEFPSRLFIYWSRGESLPSTGRFPVLSRWPWPCKAPGPPLRALGQMPWPSTVPQRNKGTLRSPSNLNFAFCDPPTARVAPGRGPARSSRTVWISCLCPRKRPEFQCWVLLAVHSAARVLRTDFSPRLFSCGTCVPAVLAVYGCHGPWVRALEPQKLASSQPRRLEVWGLAVSRAALPPKPPEAGPSCFP